VRRVLFVAYHYPPSVDAGAKRALGFHRHLPEHGWETTVLTVRGGNYATAEGGDAPDGPDVVRVREDRFPWQRSAPAGRAESAAAKGRGAGVLRRIVRSALYVPDPWRGFHGPAVRRALALHREQPFDAVLTTSTPWTALGIGAALREEGLPWVADLRDLWLRNHFGYPHGRLRRIVDARLERDWLGRADAITTTTEGQAELLRADAFGPPVHTIRNGYLAVADVTRAPRGDGEFRIVHAGKLYESGESESAPFLDALAAWRDRAPDEFSRVRADFLGRVGPRFHDEVRARGLDPHVHFHGLVARERALEELHDADVAAVLLEAAHGRIVPTKLYDALGALVPVMLIGPAEGECARLLRETEAGAAFDPGDTDGAVDWLRGIAAAGPADAGSRSARAERVIPHGCAALAGELARVLDSISR
jgi:glycosyltransferase involved in cell wall biosynthesis